MSYNYKTELERYRRYYQSLEPILRQPKAQTYTMVIFSFLTVSLFGLYAIRPTAQTILYLKREIRDKTEVSKKMDDKISALIEAQASYEEVTQLLPLIDQALPTSPDAISLIVQFRNLASVSGAELSSIQLASVPLLGSDATASATKNTNTPTQKKFDFSISIKGPYQALNTFLTGLREMRRIVSIDEFTVEPIQSTNIGSESAQLTSRLLQLTLKVTSYYMGQ